MLLGFAWQHSRKKLGGEGRGEGAVWERCHPRKPLIRPVGHLLPEGEKGRYFTQQILITKLLQ